VDRVSPGGCRLRWLIETSAGSWVREDSWSFRGGGVMHATETDVVAGLFRSQKQADAALEGLHRVGLADTDVAIGPPEPGRYRVEYHESEELGRGVVVGSIAGIVLGSVIATVVLMLAVPRLALLTTIGLGILIGAFWGVFFGGLGGMAVKAVGHDGGEPRYTVTADCSDIVLIVHAGDRIGEAHEAMQRQRPRYFLTEIPAVRPSQPPLAATA
jgi:hypothetical protein